MSRNQQQRHIIALHAAFASANDIDRFERFIYQGRASGERAPKSLRQACLDSANALARQLNISLKELPVAFVGAAISQDDQAFLRQQLAAFDCCQSLAQAYQLATKQDLLAIIGAQQGETLMHSNTLSLDASFEAYGASGGEAAVVLASSQYCLNQGAYRYASVLAFACDQDLLSASRTALAQAQCQSVDISYVEISALAQQDKAQQELDAVCLAYQADKSLYTALGSVRSVIGEGGGFAEVAGLLKCALVLHQRYYPGTADWQKTAYDNLHTSVFYLPNQSVPSYHTADGPAYKAAYSCYGEQDYCHFILQENPQALARPNGYLASSDLVLLIVAFEDKKTFQAQLKTLKKQLINTPLRELASHYYEQYQSKQAAYTLCLLAESAEELGKEIALAERGVLEAMDAQSEWKTPKGSYFTSQALKGDGVSFLYPGIGATYVGLGRELFHLFPAIYPAIVAMADDLKASLKDSILNPRSVDSLGFHDIKAIDHQLRNKLADIAECGVGFSCIFTQIFEQVFQLKADFATGYSMGEISMYAALGCWQQPGQMSHRLAQSDTFNHRLSGELQTLRQHWGLAPAKQGEIKKLWETYTLKGTIEDINEAAADEDKVYCTIINTPDSLVIGGDPDACQRVIKKLGVRAMALDMPNAIHSPPAFMEYQHMENLFTMEMAKKISTKLYSSSCYLPVPQRSKAIANSVAKCLCDPVDFPRLINTMHDKGARVFIEMGPGRSLSSWIEKTLKHEQDKAHLCVAINAKGTSDELSFMRAIAKLVSHQVPMRLDTLYHGSLLNRLQEQQQPKAG